MACNHQTHRSSQNTICNIFVSMPTDTCTHNKVGQQAILGPMEMLSPVNVHYAIGECVCMCMDAHVPSYWDICELALTAKLAIKLCHGRDPSEGCNVYHRALAQTLCHWNHEISANAFLRGDRMGRGKIASPSWNHHATVFSIQSAPTVGCKSSLMER